MAPTKIQAFLHSLGNPELKQRESDLSVRPARSPWYWLEIAADFCCDRRMKRIFPVICLLSCLIAGHSFAGSATWSANPVSGDWNTAANWTPQTVPNGPNDVATFANSNVTRISFSANTEIGQIIFASGA